MNARNLIGGFIAGAALGVLAGLLMAPYSGQKARKKLVRGSMRVKKNVVDYVENSLDSFVPRSTIRSISLPDAARRQ